MLDKNLHEEIPKIFKDKEFIRVVVSVNRTRVPQEVIHAMGRIPYVNVDVVNKIPRGIGDTAELFFVKPNIQLTPDGLDTWVRSEYPNYRLADPYEISAQNEVDPTFADKYFNGTQWRDREGNICCMTFDYWIGKRCVGVNQNGSDWNNNWWFPLVHNS